MRDEILDTAKNLIGGDRAKDYGDARANFNGCADLWRAWVKNRHGIDIQFDAEDVAVMNCMIKFGRLGRNISYKDGWIDICGYAALGGELACGDKK